MKRILNLLTAFMLLLTVNAQQYTTKLGHIENKLTDSTNDTESICRDNYEYKVQKEINYPFNKFEKAINDFSYSGYVKNFCTEKDGVYMSMFTKFLLSSITVIAWSNKALKKTGAEARNMIEFKHNGRKCMYGKWGNDEDSALFIEYPEYNMFILIAGSPNMSKSTLLQISDKFRF